MREPQTPGGSRPGRLPPGPVTFVFTDIEGSTRLLQRFGDDYMPLLDEHYRLLREAFAAHGGIEVKTIGDALFDVFTDASSAVRAVLDAQRALGSHQWPADGEFRVRIGLHTGEATNTGDDYIGLAVHQASRISDAGHGGQILMSAVTAELSEAFLPERSELRDLGEHKLRGLTEPQRIFELAHPALTPITKALRTLSSRPNNLPVQLTSFIGRERELADLKSRLLGGARLLSLVGPGGCGKTRLALEIAGELLADFPDGVWLVELADIASDSLVVQAVASAIGIREEQGRALADTLGSRLQPTKTLLVLDNCEHVVHGAARFADSLLRAAGGVQIFATTREPLLVDGETTWLVPSLSVPADDDGVDRAEAVHLFVERASAANPSFTLTPQNASVVGEICRRLDGIPLALELAAARVGVLSVDDICRRLDDRFKLLTRGSRTAMPRQQTLRALVDWSYDMLEPLEQTLLCRLAVFDGGFSLEAAEAVAPGEPVDRDDVLDGIAGLVRRSLVVVDHTAESARYRLLETIRQYAIEKLEATGEASAVRAAHRHWVAKLAARTRDRDFSSSGAALHAQLELEIPNIRAALTSGLADAGGIADALRICVDTGYFWWLRGRVSEGESWLEAVLSASADEDPVLRGYALAFLGLLAFERLDLDAAEGPLREAVAIADAHHDALLTLRSTQWLGACMTARGEFDTARALFDRRYDLAELLDEPERAAYFYLLGSLFQIMGDHDASKRLLEDAVALAQRVKAPTVLVRALPVAANKALENGDVDRAAELYREALDMARQTNDRVGIARALVFLASASLETGDYEGAESQLREATPIITREIDFPALTVRLELALGTLDLYRGHLGTARERIDRALAGALRIGRHIPDARIALGSLELASGSPDAAVSQLEEALTLARLANDPERTARSLELLGIAAIDASDLDRAGACLDEAAAIAGRLGSEARIASAEHGQGVLALARGEPVTALEHLGRALDARRRLGGGLALVETLEAMSRAAAAAGDHEQCAELLASARAGRSALGGAPIAGGAQITPLERSRDTSAADRSSHSP